MLFDQVDTALLHFLQNPIRNIDYLDKKCADPSWYVRTAHRIPLIRKLLTNEQLKSLIGHQLLKNLRQIKRSAKETLKPHPELTGKNNIDLFMSTLNQYFNIEICSTLLKTAPPEFYTSIDLYRKQALFGKLEYNCNRATENLELDESYIYSILKNPELWKTYYLSETYFLLTLDLMQASYSGDEILIKPTPKLQSSLRQRWLAETSEFHSIISDLVLLNHYREIIDQGKFLSFSDRDALTDYFLDKCLSIHVGFLSPALKNNSRYHYLRDIVFVAAFLEIRALQGHSRTHYAAFSGYINPASLSYMNSALSSEDLPKVDSAQSFIAVQGSEYIHGPLKLKYGLKKLVGLLLGNIKDPKNPHDVKSLFGNNFEQEHMIDYIRSINGNRYIVHPGFKAGTNAKIKKYDIDLVIEDSHHNTFYFIQAKYRLSDQPTFLSEQYEVMQKDDFHKGYALQLLSLKNNLADKSIRDKLNGLRLSAATEKNSHFILLHNMPFLNFHQIHGIYFYEWNLFRNLLKNGKIHVNQNLQIKEEYTLTDEQLCEPDRIVDAYFGESASGRQNTINYLLYLKTQVTYRLGHLKIRSDII